MCCGLFNTSTPERGWFIGSGVIIIALCMHSYARPYKDDLIDMVEFVSLLSTLLIFQMGMVWQAQVRVCWSRNQSNHFAMCSVESDGLPRQARDSSSSSSRKSRTKRERGRCFSSSRAQAMDPTGELTQILVRPRSFALSFRFLLKAIICQDRLGTNIRNAQAMQYMPCVLSGDCLDRSDHSRLSAGPDGRREDVCCTTRRHSRGPVGGLGGVCRCVQKPKNHGLLFFCFSYGQSIA